MTRELPESHPLHRLFRGITEATFMSELGIGDPRLVGYVANLLARFVPSQTIWRIRDAEGRRLTEVTAMVAEAESTSDRNHRRDCHRHVGDFTLFWTGVYPEALPRLRSISSADHLIDYQAQGKKSYYMASLLDDDQAAVFRRLSEQFELCAFGLSRVRREWEQYDTEAKGKGPPHGFVS